MKLFGSDLILFGSSFNFQDPSVILVAGVTNQVPQVSFNFVVEDSMLVFSYEIADIRFCELLVIFEAISCYGAQ